MHPDIRTYCDRGWRCVPIIPGTKRPSWNDWPRRATSNADDLEAWFTQFPDAGVGIATGPESGIWVLDIDPRNGGDETLHDLEAAHGSLDQHYHVLTGGGGSHYYFLWPESLSIHAGVLGRGIDVKAEGGQVLAPPSVHPETGRTYELELGGAEYPREAPGWLLDLVSADARAAVASIPVPRDELAQSPLAWDRYNAAATNELTAELMGELGWEVSEVKRTGAIHLTRPDMIEGENKEGTSATIGEVAPGVLYCWTSSVPGWLPEHPYDAAQVLARARYAGDEAACDEALSASEWGIRSRWADENREVEAYIAHAVVEATVRGESRSSWDDLDIAHELSKPPVVPSMVQRTDGRTIIYPGTVHWVQGRAEAAKTWFSLHCAAQVLATGGHIMYIDYENGTPLIERMLTIGIPRSTLLGGKVHVKSMPESWDDPIVRERLIMECQRLGVRLLIIDSVMSCMASAGLDPLDNFEVAKFMRFCNDLSRGGVAVLAQDHLRKGVTAIEEAEAMGGVSKHNLAEVVIGVEKLKQFGIGQQGVSALAIQKDRHGHLRKFGDYVGDQQFLGVFQLNSINDTEAIAAIRPWHEAQQIIESTPILAPPYQVMQGVSDYLIDHDIGNGGVSLAILKHRLAASAEVVPVAVELLEVMGYVEMTSASPKKFRSTRPYRAATDPNSPYYRPEVED